MLTYGKAESLAKAWVDIVCDGMADLMLEHTITKPYGWVFFYQSKKYLADKRFSDKLVGNAPIIVDRVNGELVVTGTAKKIEDYLADKASSVHNVAGHS